VFALVLSSTVMNWSGLTNGLAEWRVCRRASDSSSGWLDDNYSSVSSRHQLSWSRHQSPQLGGDRPRRTPHSTAVDDVTRLVDRHHGCGRQLGVTRQPLNTLTQPSSLTALVEYVSLFSTSRFWSADCHGFLSLFTSPQLVFDLSKKQWGRKREVVFLRPPPH